MKIDLCYSTSVACYFCNSLPFRVMYSHVINKTDSVTQYQFCTHLTELAKQKILLRYIYWARSSTLTAEKLFQNLLEKICLNCKQIRLSWKSPNPFLTKLKKENVLYVAHKKVIKHTFCSMTWQFFYLWYNKLWVQCTYCLNKISYVLDRHWNKVTRLTSFKL